MIMVKNLLIINFIVLAIIFAIAWWKRGWLREFVEAMIVLSLL